MPPLMGREPGPVGAALDERETWCGLIADMHHVSAPAMRIALAAKGADKVMLVTDAMSTTGSDIDSFELLGRTIFRRDGRLTTEDGTLAGSDLDMASAVRNCVRHLGVELGDALRMASPAQRLSCASTANWAASRRATGQTSCCWMTISRSAAPGSTPTRKSFEPRRKASAQNALERPAWRRMALAVCRLGMPMGTGKLR
jgi:hypothetical protein